MEVQLGWRNCSRCQGFVNVMGVGGTCLGNQMHEFSASAEYRAIVGTMPAATQPGWGSCTRCGRLTFRGAPGICWDGAGHEYEQFAPDYGVPFGPDHPGNQGRWRWCSRCQCLNDESNASRACFAGGDHDLSVSADYSVQRVDRGLQGWWRWCHRCQGLVSGENQGVCHDGQRHELHGVDTYELPFGSSPLGAEVGWRRCGKCAMLGFIGLGDGRCHAGGGHDFRGAYEYAVLIDVVPTGAHPGWRRCAKCQVLAYVGSGAGPCPAGGVHDHAASATYGLWPSSVEHGQPGFRHCRRCHSLVSIVVAHGECRGGGAHDVTTSAAYAVTAGFAPDGGESSWRRCARCQAIVHQTVPPTGRCFDGGAHDLTDSVLHGTYIATPFGEVEGGWGRCGVCRQLVRVAEAGSGCERDAAHDVNGSAAYLVGVTRPPASPPPVGPRLTLTEAADAIAIIGQGFTPQVMVKLVIRQGAAAVSAELTADGGGGFVHNIAEVVDNSAGATVLATAADDAVATGRLASFVPAALIPPP